MLHATLSGLRAVIHRKARLVAVHGVLPGWHTLARTGALMLMLATLFSGALFQIPAAFAAGSATIDWDPGMLYPGQTNPEGPVGENAIVRGTYLPSQALTLKLVQGDASTNFATVCQQTGITVKTITTDATGNFQSNFKWPASAGQVNAGYSACILTADKVAHAGTHPYTVLSANPPSISLSSTRVVQGDTITVTGQNWVPPQPLSVNIAGCAACDPGSSEVVGGNATSTGLNAGTFTLTLTIPSTTKPGRYYVDTTSGNGLLEAFYTTGARPVIITSSAPVATATAAPSPTAASTATATSATPTPVTTAPTTNTASSDNGSGGNTGFIIGLVIAILLVLLGIGVLAYFVLKQRAAKQSTPLTDHAPGRYGQYRQGMPQNGIPGAYNRPGGYNTPPPVQGAPGSFGQFTPYTPGAQSNPNPPSGYPSQPGFGFTQAPARPAQQPQPSWPTSQPGMGNGNMTFGQPAQSPAATNFYGSPTVNVNAPGGSRCVNCGNPMSPDEMFCGKCGAPREGPATSGGNTSVWIN